MRLAIVLVSVALGCWLPSSVREPDPDASRRAADVLGPFKQSLQAALKEGMAQGPESAIEVCRLEAPGLAASASTRGFRVGRTSHRLRNPANAPAGWMEPLLDFYRRAPADAGPRVVALKGGRTGYVEPIRVGGLCLTCHGEQLAPAVATRIDELYPDDRATGFRSGDFRGLFWVEFAPAE